MRSRLPKQYLPLRGRTLLEWSLAPLLACSWIEGVVVVISADDRRFSRLAVARSSKLTVTTGAATRAGSVAAGLAEVARCSSANPFVLVHDAARPCVGRSDLVKLRDEASDRHGGLLAVPAVDTLKQADKGRVAGTLDRSRVWQAQTPQMFRLDLLQDALRASARKKIEVTDEAGAMEAAGFHPRLVPASPSNLKVTYPSDLPLAAFWLAALGKTAK